MELATRLGADRYVAAGSYRAITSSLGDRAAEWAEVPAVVLSVFDRSTRVMPFCLYDRFMFPAGARPVITRVPVKLGRGAFFRFPRDPPIVPPGWELLEQGHPVETTSAIGEML